MKEISNTSLDRLRTIFEESGLSNVEISSRLSCSPAYISKLKLQDDVRPRLSFLLSVAHAFNISEKWLVEGTGQMRVSLDDKLKLYLESLTISMDPNDVYIRGLLEKYISLSSKKQTQLMETLSYLFGSDYSNHTRNLWSLVVWLSPDSCSQLNTAGWLIMIIMPRCKKIIV